MAILQSVKVRCSNCYNEFNTEIYTFVDRLKDRSVINSIFEGNFNYKHCPYCDNEGLVRFPVKFVDREIDEEATFIFLKDTRCPWKYEEIEPGVIGQVSITMKGFDVKEIITNERTEAVIYDKGELINTLISWGEEAYRFPSAPTEEELEDAIEEGVITKEEAGIIKRVDFDEILDKFLIQCFEEEDTSESTFTEDEDRALNIALRIQDWQGKAPLPGKKREEKLKRQNRRN